MIALMLSGSRPHSLALILFFYTYNAMAEHSPIIPILSRTSSTSSSATAVLQTPASSYTPEQFVGWYPFPTTSQYTLLQSLTLNQLTQTRRSNHLRTFETTIRLSQVSPGLFRLLRKTAGLCCSYRLQTRVLVSQNGDFLKRLEVDVHCSSANSGASNCMTVTVALMSQSSIPATITKSYMMLQCRAVKDDLTIYRITKTPISEWWNEPLHVAPSRTSGVPISTPTNPDDLPPFIPGGIPATSMSLHPFS